MSDSVGIPVEIPIEAGPDVAIFTRPLTLLEAIPAVLGRFASSALAG